RRGDRDHAHAAGQHVLAAGVVEVVGGGCLLSDRREGEGEQQQGDDRHRKYGQQPGSVHVWLLLLSVWTASTSAATCSGSMSGDMPWPRLNTWPSREPPLPAAWLSSTARTCARIACGEPYSVAGSRLPCSATLPAVRRAASSSVTVQSTPSPSQPLAARSSR